MSTSVHPSNNNMFDDNSSTDELFAALANPERVILNQPKRLPRSFEGLRFPSTGSDAGSQMPHVPVLSTGGGSLKGSAYGGSPASSRPEKVDRGPISERSVPRSVRSSPARSNFEYHHGDDGTGDAQPERCFHNLEDLDDLEVPFAEEEEDDGNVFENNSEYEMMADERADATPRMSREDELLEKQSVLLELERLEKQHGATLTKRYTMNDNLSDMQFEIRRHLSNVDEANMVKFMSDGMKLMCTGVELANSRFGPFLELEGWASSVTSDMGRYDSALSKLYRKYWRRSTMSPEMELAFALISSVAMHHFQKKAQSVMFGGGQTSKPTHTPHSGPTDLPFQKGGRDPPQSPDSQPGTERSRSPSRQYEDESSEDEDLPPGSPGGESDIPESVPISARKRLVF